MDAETSGRQHAIDARTLLTAASEAEARSVDARRHSALLAVHENKVGGNIRYLASVSLEEHVATA